MHVAVQKVNAGAKQLLRKRERRIPRRPSRNGFVMNNLSRLVPISLCGMFTSG
jgi:hypothetical protein